MGRLAAWACIGLMALGAAAPVVRAADEFYLRLLRQGSDAYNRRDFPTAVRQLRIAVFGLLDDPKLLADGLVRLGLAQIANGDPKAFTATFERVAEIEERFHAYSEADLPQNLRTAFEQAVPATIPAASLQEIPAFARLIPKPEDRIAQLPVKQRRTELKALMRSEPGEIRWPLMLADLELAEGNAREAREAADAALHIDGVSAAALRARGLANLADTRWSLAAADLRASKLAASDATVAAGLLRALIEDRKFKEALDEAAKLPEAIAGIRHVQELSKQAATLQAAAEAAARPTPTLTVRPSATARPTLAPRPTAVGKPSPPATPVTGRPAVVSSKTTLTNPRVATPPPAAQVALRDALATATGNRLPEALYQEDPAQRVR